MDKRYQVFVSSTYADLKEERRAVIQTVIELNCIPAGMELFPAADEEQLAFIKRVIDDCDYYLLIIGGRYGSVDETGISAAVGWVRADKAANVQVLGEINEVRKQNDQLKAKVVEYEAAFADFAPRPALEDLAGLDEHVVMKGAYLDKYWKRSDPWSVKTTWRNIFAYISPYLVKHPNEDEVESVLASALFKEAAREGELQSFDDQDFQTVGVQLKALGLVSIDYTETTSGGMALFWSLTGLGERLMVELRAVRSKATPVGRPIPS